MWLCKGPYYFGGKMTKDNRNMTDSEKLGLYITKLKERTGLSDDAIGKMSNTAESTVKNLRNAKTDNPGVFTAGPIIYALGGSLDEAYNGTTKDEVIDNSYIALKEIYEAEIIALKEVNEAHIANIRSHYEQHREDVTMNYEKRLADKREIIDMQNKHIQKMEEVHQAEIKKIEELHQAEIAKLEESNKSKTKISTFLSAIFIVLFFVLLVMEFLHPEHGWIRF